LNLLCPRKSFVRANGSCYCLSQCICDIDLQVLLHITFHTLSICTLSLFTALYITLHGTCICIVWAKEMDFLIVDNLRWFTIERDVICQKLDQDDSVACVSGESNTLVVDLIHPMQWRIQDLSKAADMASAQHEPITRIWERSPQRDPGA